MNRFQHDNIDPDLTAARRKEGMRNRKPYRSAVMKDAAKNLARKCDDGAWRSSAPVKTH